MTIELGYLVKDQVTGFIGVAENRATFLYGCARYCVQPQIDADGKIPDSQMIDEPQLKIVPSVDRVFEPMKPPKQIIELGIAVVDPISTCEGVAIGRAVYLNGCARIIVQTKQKGFRDDVSFWVDELQLKVKKSLTGKEKKVVEPDKKRSRGGPAPSSSKY